MILRGGSKIIRDDDQAVDKVSGNYDLSVSGGYVLKSGKLSLSSGLGATNITSGGPIQQIIGGSSEEIITNKDILFGNIFAKRITALNGMIAIESTGLIPLSGGIDLNVGFLGSLGTIKILPTGDITIVSTLGTAGVVTSAPAGNIIQLAGLLASFAGTGGTVIGNSASITSIDGLPAAGVHVGGSTEPAILGTKFAELFTQHQHTSSVGPTGPIMPNYASKIIKTMSKKVFLG